MKRVIPSLLFVIIFLGGISIPTFSQADSRRWWPDPRRWVQVCPLEGEWVNRESAGTRSRDSISRVVIYNTVWDCGAGCWQRGMFFNDEFCQIGRLKKWLNCRQQPAPDDCYLKYVTSSYGPRIPLLWCTTRDYIGYCTYYYKPDNVPGGKRDAFLQFDHDPNFGYVLTITTRIWPEGYLGNVFPELQGQIIVDRLIKRRSAWE